MHRSNFRGPVGDGLLGRVVDALGPIDGKGEVDTWY